MCCRQCIWLDFLSAYIITKIKILSTNIKEHNLCYINQELRPILYIIQFVLTSSSGKNLVSSLKANYCSNQEMQRILDKIWLLYRQIENNSLAMRFTKALSILYKENLSYTEEHRTRFSIDL